MKQKLEKLMYMGFGALIVLIGYSLGTNQSDNVNAQTESSIVEEIVCRQLKVVDEQGKTVAFLGKKENDFDFRHVLNIYNTKGKTVFSAGTTIFKEDDTKGGSAVNNISGDSGTVFVLDRDGKTSIALMTNALGGNVSVSGPDDKTKAHLMTNALGGRISVSGPDDKTEVRLSAYEDDGKVEVKKQDGGSSQLFTNEYGGGLAIFNKTGENVGQFSVGDRGGGVITTRDKHGYRTGSVP